jgi:hypothetical protein
MANKCSRVSDWPALLDSKRVANTRPLAPNGEPQSEVECNRWNSPAEASEREDSWIPTGTAGQTRIAPQSRWEPDHNTTATVLVTRNWVSCSCGPLFVVISFVAPLNRPYNNSLLCASSSTRLLRPAMSATY